MRLVISLFIGIWALAGAAYAIVIINPPAGSPSSLAVFAPAVVLSAALLTYAIKRRRERQTASAESDSIERGLASRAQAATMIDALVGGCALAVALIFAQSFPATAAVFLLIAAMVIDFWIRYAVLLRTLKSA